jgi:hypothetical protein
MIGLIRLFAPFLAPEQGDRGNWKVDERSSIATEALLPSWHALLGSRPGWGVILREITRPLRHLSVSLLGGLLLAAVVLAMDNHGYWFFPKWIGDESLGPALAGAFLAPFLSVVLFLAPGGNLFVASSIWKTWTLAYPGVLSFVLVSLVNPLAVRGLLRHSDRGRGLLLVLALYLAAALSGLVVTGLLTLLGLEVTHVPWFRDLVDRIIMELPFTMLGAPGSGMKGM